MTKKTTSAPPGKHNKKPQHHQSEADLKREADNKKEILRKRKIVVDAFYPALIKATISVDEAKALIHALGTLIMEDTLRTMRERRFADISGALLSTLCKDGERQTEISALLQTLEAENLFTAREIVEGMSRAIEAMVTEELRARTLESLKTNWEGYLN